jgi:phosphoribosylformimino-5-aminoimidazole carboxamide ribotide isomerase
MQLIPVIDLKDGVVVHAKLGLRSHYLPLQSPLCLCSAIDAVLAAFLTLYPFQIFYVADLNAIMGQGNNEALLKRLLADYPQLTFWIDSGYQAQPNALLARSNYQAVLGSESYRDDTLPALALFEKQFILSLDFAGHQPLGAARLFTDSQLWPDKLIVMTLARVGSNLGVDKEKLLDYQQQAPDKTWIASGGIRHKEDVIALQDSGIHFALCASALHSGAIRAVDVAAFACDNVKSAR